MCVLSPRVYYICTWDSFLSLFRLFVVLLISIGSYLVTYFVPFGIHTAAIMAASGYLLSLDLGGLGARLSAFFVNIICQNSDSQETLNAENRLDADHGIRHWLWSWCWRRVLYHVVVVMFVTTWAALMNYFTHAVNIVSGENVFGYLSYACAGVLGLVVILGEAQKVFVLGGIWRNKLFPSSVLRDTIFSKRKKHLNRVGNVRKVFLRFSK